MGRGVEREGNQRKGITITHAVHNTVHNQLRVKSSFIRNADEDQYLPTPDGDGAHDGAVATVVLVTVKRLRPETTKVEQEFFPL